MPDNTPASFSIVPWVRRGLASLITTAPATNYATLPVTLGVNNAPLNVPPVRLIGPGQITALDPRAVVRTEPRNGTNAFEPNYCAAVEFALPDLPWMFAPSAPDGGHLRPWICLIVVPEGDGITLAPHEGGISVLTIDSPLDPKNELPDLATIDSWAHAQVAGGNLSGDALNAALDGDPASTVSRLISPRRLDPGQTYLACVVPTYLAGVRAVLGPPLDDHDLSPAWGGAITAPFSLPVYYSFRFHTGPGGDFASLVQKIVPPAKKLDAGTRAMDVSQPGFGIPGVPGVTLGLEGALRSQDNQPTPWPTGAQAQYEAQLRKALSPPPAPDPVVTPPRYGSQHAAPSQPPANTPPVWMDELNLDPRTRAAASAGAQVVQRDQEALVASAWDQWGEIRKANQMLRQAQLAREVSASMNRRHLGAVASDGAFLQITRPMHARIRLNLNGVTATLRGHVQASRLPSASLSPAMRRMARPGSPIGRQLKAGLKIVDRLNLPAAAAGAVQVAGPVQAPDGMVAFDSVAPDVKLANMTIASLASAPGWILTAEVLHPVELPHGSHPPVANFLDWQSNPNLPGLLKGTRANLPGIIKFPTDPGALQVAETAFKTAAQSVITYLNVAPAPPPDPAPLPSARAQLAAALNPENTIAARLRARIGLNTTGPDPLQPLRTGPTFPQAMYAPLAELSPEWMLPGISDVPNNSATLLKDNPKFVEAYMVGLNDEMARELVWREFPVDRRTTYFQNFWGAPVPDIPAIGAFTPGGHLGDHVAGHSSGNRFIFLVRADLFQRYPTAVVSAIQARWDGSVRKLTDTRVYPIFRGTFGVDVTFFGFEVDDPVGLPDPAKNRPGWYFVIAEHPTEPRFGLEPQKKSVANPTWNDLSWDDVTVAGDFLNPATAPGTPTREGVPWSANAAALAYILMRRPVRVAMHGQALVGGTA